MVSRSRKEWVFGAAVVVSALVVTSTAQAQDFLSTLFGSFGGGRYRASSPMSPQPMPFASENDGMRIFPPRIAPSGDARSHYASAGQAYCVRTCDGRYFPLSTSGNESRAASCNSFCPASETKVVYGRDIDSAVTEGGKPYTELPNAFRYRNEIVAGCTCTGKDPAGLAQIKVEDDPTLRKGDIVAGTNGLMVASRSADKRGTAMNFSPVSAQIRAKYEPVRMMASD